MPKYRNNCGLVDKKGKIKQYRLTDPQILPKNFKHFKAEVLASMYTAEHGSITSIDHLTNGCNIMFVDSKNASMHQKRSKCRAVITTVSAPFFRSQLKKDIGEMLFSILFDETTDIGAAKVLGTVILYVDLSLENVVSTFLGMIEITDGGAETLANGVNELVTNKTCLNPDQCCGLESDNAATNVGAISGACVRLQQLWKHPLFLNRCVCHSIELAVSTAAELLSNKIEFMIKQTYLWFHSSTMRQAAYADVYRKLMHGSERSKKRLKMKWWADGCRFTLPLTG